VGDGRRVGIPVAGEEFGQLDSHIVAGEEGLVEEGGGPPGIATDEGGVGSGQRCLEG
jgi:hypothetical protein